MRIRMTNKRHRGAANVLPADRAAWEAAGWVADPVEPKKTTTKKGNDQ